MDRRLSCGNPAMYPGSLHRWILRLVKRPHMDGCRRVRGRVVPKQERMVERAAGSVPASYLFWQAPVPPAETMVSEQCPRKARNSQAETEPVTKQQRS